METFRPDCVVMQCGADSLSLDKLGALNLSIKYIILLKNKEDMDNV